MYPNDGRYTENIPSMDNMNPPMYSYPVRASSMDMSNGRPPYEDPVYY